MFPFRDNVMQIVRKRHCDSDLIGNNSHNFILFLISHFAGLERDVTSQKIHL